jgi:hypothetical protein
VPEKWSRRHWLRDKGANCRGRARFHSFSSLDRPSGSQNSDKMPQESRVDIGSLFVFQMCYGSFPGK